MGFLASDKYAAAIKFWKSFIFINWVFSKIKLWCKNCTFYAGMKKLRIERLVEADGVAVITIDLVWSSEVQVI